MRTPIQLKRMQVLLIVLLVVIGLCVWSVFSNGTPALPSLWLDSSIAPGGSTNSTSKSISRKLYARPSPNTLQTTLQYKNLIDAQLALIARRAGFEISPTDERRNRWGAVSPPQAPILSSVPPPTTAPSFPYQYIGRLEGFDRPTPQQPVNNASPATAEVGKLQAQESLRGVTGPGLAVIVKGDRTWLLGENEVLEGQWKITSIGTDQLKVQYVPLGLEQLVAMKKS